MSPDDLLTNLSFGVLMFNFLLFFLRAIAGSSALNSLVLFSDSFTCNLYSVLQGAISGQRE